MWAPVDYSSESLALIQFRLTQSGRVCVLINVEIRLTGPEARDVIGFT